MTRKYDPVNRVSNPKNPLGLLHGKAGGKVAFPSVKSNELLTPGNLSLRLNFHDRAI